MATFEAQWLGIDITTTEMALAVKAQDGQEGYASTKMRGATLWRGEAAFPAFDLAQLPGMFHDLMQVLRADGWSFEKPGSYSVACRQHDMVLLGEDGAPLLPALSWQCNAAESETQAFNKVPEIVDRVGRVEERFVLPKLACVLNRDPSLRAQLRQVLTTGDWVLGKISGTYRLSTSDALSNGLLDQESRELASAAIQAAELDPGWFPEVLQSGHALEPSGAVSRWDTPLQGWTAVAGLGDNHASGLGCGMRDEKTLVVSAGTSGTVNLACGVEAPLQETDDPAARFEFYRHHRLLLRMLAFCGDWYNRFLEEFGGDLGDAHPLLNELALQVDPARLWRIECDRAGESYRPGWTKLTLAQKVASVQFSIASELLLHVQKILQEAPTAADSLERFVLTGGLSQSRFFQNVFHAGIEILMPGRAVLLSGRTGPLRYKTSAYGALVNARLPEWHNDLANMPEDQFPVVDCGAPEGKDATLLKGRLHEQGLA